MVRYLRRITRISGPSRRRRERAGFWESVKRLFVTAYLSADPRSLGLFRVGLGAVMALAALSRWGDVEDHLSDLGWLPTEAFHAHPFTQYQFSVFGWVGSPDGVRALLLVEVAACLLLSIGYSTRVSHAVAWILLTSLNARNVAIENGAFIALNWLSLFSWWLPLGTRFSVDAVLARRKPRTRRVVSLAVLALILQWAVIYWLNYVHKDGVHWKDFSAVYYFLQQNNAITGLGRAFREALPLRGMEVLSGLTLAIEASIALLLVLPYAPGATRLVAWALSILFHGSMALLIDLGPFPWVMMAAFPAFIPREFWNRARRFVSDRPELEARRDRACQRAVSVALRFPDLARALRWRGARRVREIAVAGLMAVATLQICADNPAVPDLLRLKERPAWLATMVGYPRLFQGWMLCAPEPPLERHRLVIDAVSRNGRHLDPLTGNAPEFSVPAGDGARGQAWDEVHRRIGAPFMQPVYPFFSEYLAERARRELDLDLSRLQAFWVTEPIAPPGARARPVERRLLFDWSAPGG